MTRLFVKLALPNISDFVPAWVKELLELRPMGVVVVQGNSLLVGTNEIQIDGECEFIKTVRVRQESERLGNCQPPVMSPLHNKLYFKLSFWRKLSADA
jgi:hypothetical protein